MDQCTKCQRRLPHVQAMFDGTKYLVVCPICALVTRNRLHSLPLKTAFTGTIAHQQFCEAVAFLGASAPRWAKKVVAKGKATPGTTKTASGYAITIDGTEFLSQRDR